MSSNADLAGDLGVSGQTVRAIETARFGASRPLAFKIAQVFSHPIEATFLPEPEPEMDHQP